MNPVRYDVMAALVVCWVACGACATTRYSETRMIPAADVRGRADSRLSLHVDDAKISIETRDRVPRDSEPTRLVLEIAFEPHVLPYSFDHSQVVLRVHGKGEWRPESSPAGYVPITSGSKFTLVFGTSVTPGSEAELEIGGLARGAEPVDAVLLRIGRRSGTSIDRMYWLEALAYPVGLLLGLSQYAGG